MKSIMHQKGTCYLCEKLHGDYSEKSTQEHHVLFGSANRRLSEQYGLKIYLCLFHHTEGAESVHRNADIARLTKEDAQRAFEEHYPGMSFQKIFGKSYIEPEKKEKEAQRKKGEAGSQFFEIEGLDTPDWF